MKEETKNYDVDTMNALLSSTVYGNNPIKFKALAQKLSMSGGYAKTGLAKLIEEKSRKGDTAFVQSIAEFAQKDSNVSAALNQKDMMLAQYLREVNSGDAKGLSFEAWQKGERFDKEGKRLGTNAEFVMDKIITKDTDFVDQSASAVKRTVNLLSTSRLETIMHNQEIREHIDKDVAKAIVESAKSRGMNIPSNWDKYLV